MSERISVGIVPHTHWDREWYEPFQTFRVRLVHLLDQLLDLLETDERYARFLLDGQTVVIDDYLEIRPDAAARLDALAAAGRLQVGPWMVLMDEYMVSGETIVRDLQRGIRRATALGGLMEVGYLPDMFGHVAQMPQLFRLAGLDHAVVWRGVPAAITQTAFWWDAPDGSRVRAEYLYGSYSNGRDLPADADGLVARARGYELELGQARLAGGGMLLMNGTDHHLPQPWLGEVVAKANDHQDRYEFTVTSLPEYLARQPSPELAVWQGELRSGARANVLMGVASNRVDVHRACAVAERALERRAEPLSALFLEPSRYPSALLDVGWHNLVLNSAHDSSCACSADEVVDAVIVRYQEARQVGDALAKDAVRDHAARIAGTPGTTVVVNPTARTRGGLVHTYVPGVGAVAFVATDGTVCPTQVLREVGGEGFSTIVTGEKVRWVLELLRGQEFAGARVARVERAELAPLDWEYTFHAAGPGDDPIDLEDLREELLERGAAGETIRFRQSLPTSREVLFHAADVAGFGWKTYRPVDSAGPATKVTVGDLRLANEHLEVTVDATTGALTISTIDGVVVSGANALVDGGDGGDTYNYSAPEVDTLVSAPTSVEVVALETGPVRATLLVVTSYDVPVAAIGDERSCSHRSDTTTTLEVRTTLELRCDERFLRVHAEIDNTARDHRLRAHFPLPAPVAGSDAECAFTVVHRGLTAEGGPSEHGLPTFVSRRFVDCSDGDRGLALLHDGLLEYEVLTDDADEPQGHELALTLLRATGYLSRLEIALRPDPAGPPIPVEGPQLHGRHVVDYAVLPHRGAWHDADLHAAADDFLVGLERGRVRGGPGADLGPDGRHLRVDGAEVSAVLREAGALVLRAYNPLPETSTLRITREGAPVAGDVIDLRGRSTGVFTGELPLRSDQIATVRLSPG
ncbi:MAG TPA: glycoside hydrolase family 38 C-terminal domain-containing protein [Acidimicrobiia bacterium]|nr:glycoside hydrolase family 38 C-terminal domain-containing protein [Acidimicrobiia bacterium]